MNPRTVLRRLFTWLLGKWTALIDYLKKDRPDWTRGPYITSATHALITVLGLWPHQPKGEKWRLGWRSTLGPLGMVLQFTLGIPWLWIFASTATLIWYWIRDYNQTGLKPKPKHPPGTTWTQGAEPPGLSFGQRYDTWMDVIFPTIAYAGQVWWLL